MSGYSREAEALARVLWGANTYLARYELAQRAIDAGWQPPPDPHETIARELWAALADMWPVGTVWQPHRSKTQADLLALVRRMFPDADEARAIAGRVEGEP